MSTPPPSGSTLITSAPSAASVAPPRGAATKADSSTTRRPARIPSMGNSMHEPSGRGEPPVGGVPRVGCSRIGREVSDPRRHLSDLRNLEQRDRAVVAQPLAFGVSVGGPPRAVSQGRLPGSEGCVQGRVLAAVPVARAAADGDGRPRAWIWRPLVGGESHIERALRSELQELLPAPAAGRRRGSERQPLAAEPIKLVVEARATADAGQAELQTAP